MISIAVLLALSPVEPPTHVPPPTPVPIRDANDAEVALGERWRMLLGPADAFYAPYVADPRRPTLALKSIHANSTDIAGAGKTRFGLRVGTRFELLRFYERGRREDGIQVDGEVGILAQFDRDNSTDNLGWDGIYGLYVSRLLCEDVAVRVGIAHDSSHLGDEFIESTGRTRLMYTREELRGGLSWRFAPEWRTYAEYGHAYDLRNKQIMEEGRAQAGLEYECDHSPWNGRARPWAAVDLGAYEEDDWELNVSLQGGVLLEAENGALWRLGVELYDGRSPIGEFFQSEETYLSWGVWLDL
jgi:hypothetical protein